MKLISLFLVLMLCLACSREIIPQVENDFSTTKVSDHSKKESNFENKLTVGTTKKRPFEVNWGKEKVKGMVDSGSVIIEYPTELYGSIKLLRFDGSSKPNEPPFSQSHCDDIRRMAKNGAGLLVRTAYRSVLSFAIPVVTSSSFSAELIKELKSRFDLVGEIIIQNPLIYYQGYVKIILEENSISRSLGDEIYLTDQVNLSTNGSDIDLNHKLIIVISGDLLCDLASKQAKIEMMYPIKGDRKSIKVVFDKLDLE